MGALNLVPPLFRDTLYFDNVYFTILYALLTYLAISIPVFIKLNKQIERISFSLGAWFCCGLIFEIANFFKISEVYNSKNDTILYFKFCFAFILTILLNTTHSKWQSQRKI